MLDSLTDEELVSLIQKGDEDAFAMIMHRYTDKLLRYGRRIIPKEDNIGDIVQDVFVTVYQNIQDFDASRKFSPWIYRIAHNAFVDVVRRNVKGPIYAFDFDKVVPYAIEYEDPENVEKERQEMNVLINRSVGELPTQYKEIVDLYYFENFSYKEISDILRIPIGTVGIRLSRAKDILKKSIKQKENER